MLEIIAGEKGKGKTKILIQKVNDDVKLTNGNLVYLDKNNKHMYELSNHIRLINIPEYHITNTDMFLGFISGIISQDHDLDKIYLDNFRSISGVTDETLEQTILALLDLSNEFEIDMTISLSGKKEDLSEQVQALVTVAL